MKYLKDF